MKNPTLTIGIPAHNEAKNIGSLIRQLLSQDYSGITLDKIIVYSDGSTDSTVSVIRKFNCKHIKTIENKTRQGISFAQNQIIKKTTSDILLLLDADISILDSGFINKITAPIIKNQADLVSARLVELGPKKFYSRMLWVSQQVKNNVFNQINSGNGVFNCKGPVRAFSKKLYKHVVFPKNIANDVYSYLRCQELNMKFNYVQNTEVYYKQVDNFADHQKQSTRFFQTSFSHPSTKISFDDLITGWFLSIPIMVRYPLHSIAYLFIQFYFQLISLFMPKSDDCWQMATSSK